MKKALPLAKSAFVLAEQNFPESIPPDAHLAARNGFIGIRAALHTALLDENQFSEAISLSREFRALVDTHLGQSFHAKDMSLDEQVAERLALLSPELRRNYQKAKNNPIFKRDPAACQLGGKPMLSELESLGKIFQATVGAANALVVCFSDKYHPSPAPHRFDIIANRGPNARRRRSIVKPDATFVVWKAKS